jgi:hypothetical protein
MNLPARYKLQARLAGDLASGPHRHVRITDNSGVFSKKHQAIYPCCRYDQPIGRIAMELSG